MATTNRFNLTQLATTQAQKEVVHNEAIGTFDAWVQATVISVALTTPPVSPSKGDSYVVAVTGSGSWAGHSTDLAVFNGATWSFYTPLTGCKVWNLADSETYTFTGSVWEAAGATTTGPYILSLFVADFIDEFFHAFTGDVTFPANLTGSVGFADTASSATVTYTLYRKVSPYSSRTSLGTLVFNAGVKVGVFTFPNAVTFNATDMLELVGPPTADPDMANVAISIKGTRG